MSLLELLIGRRGSEAVVFYLPIDENVNIIIDGNSIWSDDMGIPGMDALFPWTSFIASTGCTVANTSIAGQTWADMAGNLADVEAAIVPGKVNVLISGETRNSFFNPPMTVEDCLADAGAYATGVAALDIDFFVLMGSLPSDGVPTAADENAGMLEVDEYMRDHLDEFGAVKFIWYRDISAFAGDGTSQQGFMSSPSTCLESSAPWVHPDGSARDAIATRMVRDVQLIPV